MQTNTDKPLSFSELVIDTLVTGDKMQNNAARLAELASKMPYLAYNNEVCVIIGKHYGVAPYVSRKGDGALTFEKDSREEKRLKSLRLLHPEHVNAGKVKAAKEAKSNKAEPVGTPDDVAALAAKLVKLCGEYECDARKLAAQAVAEAFAALKAK